MSAYLDINFKGTRITNAGDKMLRRDGNGGEKDTWESFTVNFTYFKLMQEFPNDYRHLDGVPYTPITPTNFDNKINTTINNLTQLREETLNTEEADYLSRVIDFLKI